MRMRLALFTLVLSTLMFIGAPFVAQAQTADQLRAQIAEILAEIYALRNQLQFPSVPQPPPVTPPIATPVPAGSGLATFQYSRCPDLQFNLQRGDADGRVAVEVTMLQRFLSQDPRLYPEGQITGYFGPATERAVQRFQERHGIVTYGDYQATGYGRVGPRTRHAIKNSCGVAGTNAFTVSPIAGAAPLQVAATFEYSGSSCTSYQLDWGDGSTPVSQQAPSTASCSNDSVRKQATHTYTSPGAYEVTLRVGKNSVYALPIVGRATVVASGVGGSASQASLVLSTVTGSAPLTVTATLRSETPSTCTSYALDWGDNTQSINQEAGTASCATLDTFTQQFTHTYSNAGVYSVRARAGRGALANLGVIQQNVTVTTSNTPVVTSTCFIEPASGAAPLAARARILLGGSLCDGSLTYAVEWGDGTSSATQSCADQNPHYVELNHTYKATGSYTARLQQSHPNARFAEQTCAVTVNSPATTGSTISNSCKSWTDGCNTCSRSYVGGPAACTQRHCLQYGQQQCYQNFSGTTGDSTPTADALSYESINAQTRTVNFVAHINTARSCNGGLYTIHFGDGLSSVQPFPADACQVFTRRVSHSYTQNGTYTATLVKDGVAVNISQVTVTLSGSSHRGGFRNVASVLTAIENFIRSLFK